MKPKPRVPRVDRLVRCINRLAPRPARRGSRAAVVRRPEQREIRDRHQNLVFFQQRRDQMPPHAHVCLDFDEVARVSQIWRFWGCFLSKSGF